MLARAVRAAVMAALVGGAVACDGGDDGADDDGADPNDGKPGTCDLRTRQSTCIELHGASPRRLSDQQAGCLEYGSWSREPCPETPELIGCCEYTFGGSFRECFYQGTSRANPEGDCLSTTTWSDGVWTPAGA